MEHHENCQAKLRTKGLQWSDLQPMLESDSSDSSLYEEEKLQDALSDPEEFLNLLLTEAEQKLENSLEDIKELNRFSIVEELQEQ